MVLKGRKARDVRGLSIAYEDDVIKIMVEDNWFKKLQIIPIKSFIFVLGASFFLANGLSLLVAHILLKEQDIRVSKKNISLAEGKTSSVNIQQKTIGKKDISAILERNLFNSEGKFPDDETIRKDNKAVKGEIPNSDLPLKLSGIIYGGNAYSSIAVIENTSKKSVSSFMMGDLVMQDAVVKDIQKERVVFERSGNLEQLIFIKEEVKRKRGEKSPVAPKKMKNTLSALATKPPPPEYREEGLERKGTKTTMTLAYKQRLLGVDLAKVLQDAKADVYVVDGEIRGYILNKIREDSIYYKSGFQEKDIVLEINGTPLGDPAQAIKFLNSMINETTFEILVKRGESTETLVMSVQ